MKNKLLFPLAIFAACICIFLSCQNETLEEGSGNKEVKIIGKIKVPDVNSYDNFDVVSIGGEAAIKNGVFQIDSYSNDCVQTFMVMDATDNVYLMSRIPSKNVKEIELNAYTTAIALVTSHPLLAPISADDYGDIVNLITSSSKFEVLYGKVEQAIYEKRNIFDSSNEELLIALSDLMDDICIEEENKDEEYDGTLDEIITTYTNSRARYKNPKVYFYADITGNVLTLRNIGLTPSYYGNVTKADGQQIPFKVPARGDYGGMDIFKENVDEFMLGDPQKFTFTDEGEYQFYLSRMNELATADFYLRLANSILTTLGLDLGNDVVQELGNTISRAMINAGSGVDDTVMDPMEWVGIAYNATLEWAKQDYWEAIGKGGIIRLGTALSGSLNFYNKIKGIFNASMRLAHSLSAPKEVSFCLCYYDNQITTCSDATLHLVSGDQQQGFPNQKLLLPLVVYVQTLGDDGMYHESSSYHRVKFEVVSGGGEVEDEMISADENNQALTYWTLGESDEEQKVKVTVIDVITEKEISEPVYFTATTEEAQITIRLDWSKHSGNTDIDLHVVDPYGEEIAYYNMYSSSGGYLDRDDVVGPGPEHVRWTDAPAGTYKIYVHYYPNEEEDRSVTSYTVSVTANDITYQPKSGSIAYDQYVPVGQFTIGENYSARSASIKQLDVTDVIEKKNYPRKKSNDSLKKDY